MKIFFRASEVAGYLARMFFAIRRFCVRNADVKGVIGAEIFEVDYLKCGPLAENLLTSERLIGLQSRWRNSLSAVFIV